MHKKHTLQRRPQTDKFVGVSSKECPEKIEAFKKELRNLGARDQQKHLDQDETKKIMNSRIEMMKAIITSR